MSSSTAPPPPRFEHIADLHLDLAAAIPGGKTPFGVTNWFEITGGTLKSASTVTGPKLSATVLSGGGDYSTLHAEAGAITLDVSAVAKSDDEEKAFFKFHNTGVIKLTEKNGKIFSGEVGKDVTSTEFGEEVCLERIVCNTGSETWG